MNTAESGQRMSVDPELHDAKRGTFRSIGDRGGSRMSVTDRDLFPGRFKFTPG